MSDTWCRVIVNCMRYEALLIYLNEVASYVPLGLLRSAGSPTSGVSHADDGRRVAQLKQFFAK